MWAWNRSAQRWNQHDFGSPVVGVEELTAGILVVAEHSAAIYDSIWGEWLPALQTGETLEAP